MLTDLFLDVMRGKPKLIHELVSEIPLQKSNALMKGLAKDQDKRHDNCGLFASEVDQVLSAVEAPAIKCVGTFELLARPELDRCQSQRQAICGHRKAGVHENPEDCMHSLAPGFVLVTAADPVGLADCLGIASC